ncbi:MAG: hypothetical protein ACYC5G_00725 [Candidatus Doudnabacteria bacterium]
MITISKAIEDAITSTPYLEEAMGKGIINLSALARELKPGIKKQLYKKDVSDAALLMALKRYQPSLKRKASPSKLYSEIENITVRSNLIEITLKNSAEVDQIRKDLMKMLASEKGHFFNFIQGVKESTLIISKDLEQVVTRHLSGKAISKITNLSSITISLPPENRTTPGIYYNLLKVLAWNNVNLIEIVSNYNEVSLIFDNSQIDKAFSLIKSLTNKN